MRYYGYDEFVHDVRKLAATIGSFDTYVAVARGGLTLAHFLAEAKDVRRVVSITAIGYEGDRRLDRLELQDLPDLSQSSRILIVEDIVDSGRTIATIKERLQALYPQKIFKVAALFYKQSASVQPDFFVKYADEWIEFFWTKDIR